MTIAFWCVLIAAILPYLFVGFAKAGRDYDNAAPREYLARVRGRRQRAHWAQLNSFEAFPPFAAAVIIAHLAAAPQDRVDVLAVAFIVLRIAYGAVYVLGWSTVRSLVWAGAVACIVGLFIVAA